MQLQNNIKKLKTHRVYKILQKKQTNENKLYYSLVI